jgi:hypothetical protein
MLRNALLLITFCVAALGFACVLSGYKQAWPATIWGLVIFILILIERWRYQRTDHSGGEWVATDEQFIDPETGKLTKVFYKSETGERRYVVADGP